MDIGSRIREHRAAAGMKQDELAQACFVSRQTIRNWGLRGYKHQGALRNKTHHSRR